MSAREERTALTPGAPLHDYALFRHGIEPDGRIPRGGYPLPDAPPAQGGGPAEESRRPRLTMRQAQAEATGALAPPLADPDPVRAAETVHARVRELRMPRRTLRACVRRMPLPDEAAARRTARLLARTGSDPAAVGIGVALLTRLGEPEDLDVLRTLGTLNEFSGEAVAALDRIDRQAAAVLALSTGRHAEPCPHALLTALADGNRDAVRAALTDATAEEPPDPPRRFAEAARLDELLHSFPLDTRLTTAAGRLLLAMAHTHQRPEILDYGRARTVYEAVVAGAHRLTPSRDAYALLLSLAQDLHSGAGSVLDWAPGRRTELLGTLGPLLAGPAWAAVPERAAAEAASAGHGTDAGSRRTAWILRTGQRPFAGPTVPEAFRIEVVVADPADRNLVETRILLDGRPVVPSLFASGGANPPEQLLDTGRLRAGPEPREVQLAEAYCTEGCCGALYVTVRRDGDAVVWDGWRGVEGGAEPPAYRFDAAVYDAEVERAENDRSWSWPARDTARLIARGLRERPELLGAWGCRPGWAGTVWDEPETVLLSFVYAPGDASGPVGTDRPWLQFAWRIPDDGTPPEARARAALGRLAEADPRTWARMCGGSKEHAEALGHPWPPEDP
ncbi:hypothetical protein [Streptomyces sp. NPDC089799]|uniref:hypothetical protein n=1 Tax=Streptomyces sp. NPDC089799 TaxID=3155066 RepID=UPI003412136C